MPSFLITPVITLSVLGFESDLRREARWWQTGTQHSGLHPSSSSWSSAHGDPPPDAGTATGRSRFRLPPPQVAEQGVQGCQSPRTQSTRASTLSHAALLVAVSSLV